METAMVTATIHQIHIRIVLVEFHEITYLASLGRCEYHSRYNDIRLMLVICA